MKRPYYIATPSYTERSGGVMGLHQLCSKLNGIGEKAWLAPMDIPFQLSPYPNAPMLTPEIYRQQGLEPICIYPDVIKGNPCNAKHIVRFFLAAPGAFNGETQFPETEMMWSFSHNIAAKTRSPNNVLSVPVTNMDVYKPGNFKRAGACFFSNKYDRVHGNEPLPLTEGATRLAGTREFMVETMQRSEVCYVYENSAVSVEAALCGCPVVLIRTSYFRESWLHDEFGWAGVRWSNEEGFREDISRARANCDALAARFDEEQLPKFARETQEWFRHACAA